MRLPNQPELLKLFSSFLFEAGLSAVSVKNYLSDMRHFLGFATNQGANSPEDVLSRLGELTSQYLSQQKSNFTPNSTTMRRLASIRRFSTFVSVKFNLPNVFTHQIISKDIITSQPSHSDNQLLQTNQNVSSTSPSSENPLWPNRNNHQTLTTNKILEQFKHSLEKEKKTHSTIKNYISDLHHFFNWTANQTPFTNQNLLNILSESQLNAYTTYLRLSHTSTSVINRRQSSIKKLARFCHSAGYIPQNPFENKPISAKIKPLAWIERLTVKPKTSSNGPRNRFTALYHKYNNLPWTPYLNIAILALATTAMAIFAYNQVITSARPGAAATSLTPPKRQLSFQGRLTDSAGTPITTSVNVTFKLFNALTGPTQLYTSGTCSITPDQDGIFNTLIGDGVCGAEITSTVFTDNRDVFLEVTVGAETLTPRQQIATVGYALNSETLQGYPASAAATINTVPVIDNNGDINIAVSSPSIISSSGTFSIVGQSLALQTADNSGGDIILQPDSLGSGQILGLGGTTTEDSVRITNANLTTGALVSGYVGRAASSIGRIISLTSGTTETDRFWVGVDGRTSINTASLDSALTINQTSTGNLISASVSGTAKFTVTNAGNVDISGQYLINGVPISTGGSNWQRTSGSLAPLNITDSINIGAIATSSALVHLAGTSAENSFVNTGNFGIGNNNPGQKLDVTGNVRLSGTLLANSDNTQDLGDSTNSWSRLYLYTGINDKDGTEVISTLNKRLTGGVAWNIVTGARIGDTAAITSGYELDVNGDTLISGNLVVGDGSTGTAKIGSSTISDANTSYLAFDTDTNSSDEFRIYDDGSLTLKNVSSVSNTTEGTIYYDTDINHLYLSDGSSWHRLALDMTKYSSNSANIANQSYIEINHNQNTNDLSLTAWVYNTATNIWQKISELFSGTVNHDLDNEFNAIFAQKQKTTAITITSSILGTGADGDITISSDTNINTANSIANRSCADGGDAVNYSVTALTDTTATLSTTPSSGCLSIGDEILLINQQGTSTKYGNVGNYETLRIGAISGASITFTTTKIKYYGDNPGDDTNLGTGSSNQRVMLQRVPNYDDVTITTANTDFTPSAWNGTKGGVMFFRATGTVSIASSTTINANGLGYAGGTAAASNNPSDGGESFCGNPGGGAGDDQDNSPAGGAGTCGGGGGGGANASGSRSGYSGSSTGGAGGGAGTAGSLTTSGFGFGGGGGGGSYGESGVGAGTAGGGSATNGTAGGSSTSGAGGNGNYTAPSAYGGGGGGGGTYGDANLSQIFLGSGGAGGGGGDSNGTLNTVTFVAGGTGGNGGGVVSIYANTLSVSGAIQADGSAGTAGSGTHGGSGGSGAGGSVKLVGNTLTLGTNLVSAGGAAATTTNADGGAGGDGRIATAAFVTSTGSTNNPSSTSISESNGNYAIFVSKEINTPGATAFTSIDWTESLQTYGLVSVQARSGATPDSTDGTWTDWKPTASNTTIYSMDSQASSWTSTNLTDSDSVTTDPTRDVNYFEDDDVTAPSGKYLKLASVGSGDGYTTATPGAVDLTQYDLLSAWVYATKSGDIKIGFGESTSTEVEKTVHIDEANTWQKVYWDITDLSASSCAGPSTCNSVDNFRLTVLSVNQTIYVDNLSAERLLTKSGGGTPSTSLSATTANNYFQYRAVLSTTNSAYNPTASSFLLTYTDSTGSHQIDIDSIRKTTDQNYYSSDRLTATETSLNDIKTYRADTSLTSVSQRGDYDPGTGADGDITVSSSVSINSTNLISGRSCADGGDAVNYSVIGLGPTYATLSATPSVGCLNIGDEVLLINLQGTTTGYANVGNYETLRVAAKYGPTVTFTASKTKYYGDNAGSDANIGINSGNQRVMLQRVPNYRNVTVNSSVNFTPTTYNDIKGGVMFFRASGTVSVGTSGTINANGSGYAGGTAIRVGGESFCSPGGAAGAGTGAGGGGAVSSSGTGGTGVCGGGGGGGPTAGTGGTGSANLGGAGGGGGTTGSTAGGGGGGAGYGTAGNGASGGGGSASNGGTSSSGNGGSASSTYGGGGGGGGTYGSADLSTLMMGSGGGAAGSNALLGGNGGGIIYISANSVTVSGGVTANGVDGSTVSTLGSGGGSGGSIKILGNTLSLGSSLVTASGGTAGGSTAAGGSGGSGRIATYYATSTSGTTSPTAQSAQVPSYNYSVFISDEIPTPNATNYQQIKWLADLDSYGLVELQTRSGKSNNSTDGTWEAWLPSTTSASFLSMEDMNTHTTWSGTNLTVANGSTITRNVNYYEDEDVSNPDLFTKLSSVGSSNGYAETSTMSANIASYDYITAWVYATSSGNLVKLGFGETTSSDYEKTFHIDTANTWQKIYWDITNIDTRYRDAVDNFRISVLSTNTTIYIDNIAAEKHLSNSEGSTISSTPNNYIQYRAILTTTNSAYHPKLHNVQIDWNNGYKVEQTTSNAVRLYNFTGETQQLRLDAIVFGADLAEWYTINDDAIDAGDLVAITGTSDQFGVPILGKTQSKNDRRLLGVISTRAGQTLGIEAENRRLLALAGRVPVKMDIDSPSIKPGDYLTASDKPGLARKARPGEMTIGRAFESWHHNSPTSTVLVIVQQPGETPETDLATSIISITRDTWEVFDQTANQAITRLAAFSELVTGRLTAGLITAKEVKVDTIAATSSESAIFINSPVVIGSTINAQSANINHLYAEHITTKSITAESIIGLDARIASLSAISHHTLSESDMAVIKSQVEAELANATASASSTNSLLSAGRTIIKFEQAIIENFQAGVAVVGDMITTNLTVKEKLISPFADIDTLKVIDATISGTLYADNIKGHTIDRVNLELDLLNDKYSTASAILSDLQARYSTYDSLLSTYRNSTTSADILTLSENATASSLVNPNLSLDTFSVQTLMASDIFTTGTTITQSLSSIGTDLFIQPTADQPVHLLGNLLSLYPTGKVVINGDVLVSGTVLASGLDTKTATISGTLALGRGEMASTSANLVSLFGDNGQIVGSIDASGSATFGQLITDGLIIAADNLSHSSTASGTTTSNTTVGIATIATGSAEVKVNNQLVRDGTLIYVTPLSDTKNQVLYVKSKESGVGFTVATPLTNSSEISFNYWLIQTK